MKTEQIYEIMNDVTQEVLDGVNINEDLSNIVQVGEAVFNANAYEGYVKALVNRIGKTVFVNRAYMGGAPSVLMDAWEYGSVLQKVDCDIPEAQENESWNLENGVSYDPNIFKSPKVNVKFYNNQVTFEVQMSFVMEKQIKQSFINLTELNAFISMIYNAIDKSMTIKVDKLISMTIANAIGETIYNEFSGGVYNTSSGVRAVNLLYLYNQENTPITKAEALHNLEFLKFASKKIALYTDYMTKISTLFNIGGRPRFTPQDLMHIVLLSEFTKSADIYLQSSVYHDEMTKLPQYENVAYWQSSGTKFEFDDVSKINITTAQGHSVTLDGIIGIIFDRDALGVCNYDRRTTSDYNARAEFINTWFKMEARYFNDFNENIVVFFIQ